MLLLYLLHYRIINLFQIFKIYNVIYIYVPLLDIYVLKILLYLLLYLLVYLFLFFLINNIIIFFLYKNNMDVLQIKNLKFYFNKQFQQFQ